LRLRIWLVCVLLLSAGCGSHSFYQLMPTPNLYLNGHADPFDSVPPVLQSGSAEILYVTDRTPKADSNRGKEYGYGRDRSLAFGTINVHFGKDLSWDELVAASREKNRKKVYDITCTNITELGRFPATPEPFIDENGVITTTTKAVEAREKVNELFRAQVATMMARSSNKDVYLFIHGYACEFEWGSYVIAQLWHFMGRGGLPIAYSWPAGSPGILRGYQYDRESGEFTVFHLKQFLKLLASCPQVHRIHIIAHSRGTDVATTAIRELKLEIGDANQTQATMKFGRLVLAAADLDADVMTQRIGAERLEHAVERTTIYVSKNDRALGVSDWLFNSRQRLGMLQPKDLSSEQLALLHKSGYLEAIDARVTVPSIFSHSYFIANPAVSSDLILLVRDGLVAGAAYGRPLIRDPSGFWIIDDNYPAFSKATTTSTTRPITARSELQTSAR
jgi:esterase/lipase superfamily enzyme